ncbi:hypothetical protein GCM10023093_10810 [Nemorincola caseinilytica]|uniref:Uncharacterized protein n=1 Tax=Nemorincola caseinilytica TaxID=2054315 RepID=A0ABP8NBH0_9BACT
MLVFMLPLATYAQSEVEVKEGNVKMGKKKMWAFSATYRHDKSVTAAVLDKNMEDAKLKRSSRKKGVQAYKAAQWPAVSDTRGDYYYRVRSKKGKTTVYMVASKGYDNYVTTTNDAATAAKVTQYLQRLDGQIAAQEAIQQKEVEMKQLEAKNAAMAKELEASKEAQAKKAKEVRELRATQFAPAPVK